MNLYKISFQFHLSLEVSPDIITFTFFSVEFKMNDVTRDKTRALLGVSELPGKLIREALTVAGADSNNPDGFKNLAQLGTAHINACLLEMGYRISLSRVKYQVSWKAYMMLKFCRVNLRYQDPIQHDKTWSRHSEKERNSRID